RRDFSAERQSGVREDASEGGAHAPSLATEQVLERLHYTIRIGRTSTHPPCSKMGQAIDSSLAWVRSPASTTVKPMTRSFSTYGPSVMLRFGAPVTIAPERSRGIPRSLI